MLSCKEFYSLLGDAGISFYTGVPDSLLKDFCSYITDNTSSDRHIITANEGNAVALGSGFYLSSNEVPLVYMQNSGLGNCINPLTSLTDKMVYSIPMVLMIGWRGEPGVKDEPQHQKQGLVTLELLECLNIDYIILSEKIEEARGQVETLVNKAKSDSVPVAIVVKKGTFEKYKLQSVEPDESNFSREDAIGSVVNKLPENAVVLSTTGKISRELYEYKVNSLNVECSDFLNVGAMGHVSQIALGVSLHSDSKEVICFDGDGAALMHMGGMAIVANNAPSTYRHIVFNNFAHDSVGGQPTVASKISLTGVAEACGYKYTASVNSESELSKALDEMFNSKGPSFLEIKVSKGSRSDLGRPKSSPFENKVSFMKALSRDE